jgi:hypothetical protein
LARIAALASPSSGIATYSPLRLLRVASIGVGFSACLLLRASLRVAE